MEHAINYWIPELIAKLAALESAIAGKSTSAMVRAPWGDATPKPVSEHAAFIAAKRGEIALARTMAALGLFMDGTPI